MMEKFLNKLPRAASVMTIASGGAGLTWTLWQAGVLPLLHRLAPLLVLVAGAGLTLASLGVAGAAVCRRSVTPSERANQLLLRVCCGWLLLAGTADVAWTVQQCGLTTWLSVTTCLSVQAVLLPRGL